MEIKFYGAQCVKLITKQSTFVIDDNLASLGMKSVTKESDKLFFTSKQHDGTPRAEFVCDSAGEFELGNMIVQGYAVRGFNDEQGKKTSILYTFITDRMTVVVAGNLHPSVDTTLLESIGIVDALIIPVGGGEQGIDAAAALKISNKLNPSVLIPTNYTDAVENFIEEAKQEVEHLDNVKLKPGNGLEPSSTQIVVLNKS